MPEDLRHLLNEADSLLSLVLYRGEEHDLQWRTETRDLLIRIRKALKRGEA